MDDAPPTHDALHLADDILGLVAPLDHRIIFGLFVLGSGAKDLDLAGVEIVNDVIGMRNRFRLAEPL